MSHLYVVTPLTCQSLPCDRFVKISSGVRDLLCRGLAFVPSDGAFYLFVRSLTIAEAIQTLLSLLVVQPYPFKEALNWLQLVYIAYWKGYYAVPAFTVLVQSMVSEGDLVVRGFIEFSVNFFVIFFF